LQLVHPATVGRQGEDIQQECGERNYEHYHNAHKDSRQWAMSEENGSREPPHLEHDLVMRCVTSKQLGYDHGGWYMTPSALAEVVEDL